MIDAQIIADSLNPVGDRITSFVCTFPRIILAEVNTHRMFSRNSASSRAIPFEKMLERVSNESFIPKAWMKDHKGMQGVEYFEEDSEKTKLLNLWLDARDNAVKSAIELSKFGLTKQIVNRLLEPFMMHTAIITATDYENFFHLRCNPAAEIHLQELAWKMKNIQDSNKPRQLEYGQWHIPFGIFSGEDIKQIESLTEGDDISEKFITDCRLKISTARCARVSYLNFEGKNDFRADIKLHDTLAKSGHWSPFEHCAMAMPNSKYSGNFRGFAQYRKMFDNENITVFIP